MKRTKAIQAGILALALVFGMTMAACGGKTQAQPGGNADTVQDAAGKAAAAVTGAANSGKPAEASDFIYRLNTARTGVVITGIQEDAKFGAHLVVPSEIEGFPVVAYLVPGNSGHSDYEAKKRNQPPLESVVLPDSITYMGESDLGYDWDGQHGFRTDDWGMPNTPFYLQNSGFSGCNSLKSIVFPKNLQVAPSLKGLPSLNPEGITWPEALIIMHGFGNDTTTEVVIPDGVKIIYGEAFSRLKNLTTVTIPDSVEEIRDFGAVGPFTDCPELTTVNLPAHPILYSSAPTAFGGCPKLGLAAQQAIKNTGYTGRFR
jgi:hypothetical protein